MTRKARKLVTALCCIAISTAAIAQEDPSFRLLELDGYAVRWTSPPSGPLVLSYKIVNRPTALHNSRTCGVGLTSFDRLAERSKLTLAAIRDEVAEATRMWEAVANVKFVETGADDADILIGVQTQPSGYAFADVYFDSTAPTKFKPISKGLVCLNPDQIWKIGFGGPRNSYDLRFTFAHELGHVLGLDHPRDSGGQLMGFKYHEKFRSIQKGDALAAALLYGRPTF